MIPTYRHRAATLLAALPLLGASVAMAGTAHADTWSHRDAKGDVLSAPTETGKPTRAPGDKTTDITRISVNHAARKVVVTVKVRDLRRGGDTMLLGRIVTPKNDYAVMVMQSPDMQMFSLYDEKNLDEGIDATSCRGKRLAYQAARNRIRITIPRSCLGDPRWVRTGALLVRGVLSDESTVTMDDALRKGISKKTMNQGTVSVGRRVRVG